MAKPETILAHDPTAATPVHLPDDRFIPVRPRELSAAICADTTTFCADAPFLARVFAELEEIVQREALALERELIECYFAFNPDRETLAGDHAAPQRLCEPPQMFERLEYLFGKANFARLDPHQIEQVARFAGARGLSVRLHPERVQHLSVWVRGRGETRERLRTRRHPLRGEPQPVPMYRRLAIIAQLRDDPNLLLKLFKDIPIADVEVLLPHAEVQMSFLDRALALWGTFGTIGSTSMKIASVISGAVFLSKVLWILLLAAATLALRGFMGFRHARVARDALRTRHLYFQNLDNNGGVITSLVASIAHEDLKETMLAYALCNACAPRVVSAGDLKHRAERFLQQRFGMDVQFDVEDALETLDRLGLFVDRATFDVVEPAGAVVRLHDHVERQRALLYLRACGTGGARRVDADAAGYGD
jgi:hypothetical protein